MRKKKRTKFKLKKKKEFIHVNKSAKTVELKRNTKDTLVKNTNALTLFQEGAVAGRGSAAMFDQIVQTALSWRCKAKLVRRNPPRRIGESGKRRILRMAKAGYDTWEAWQILGTYDYSTIKKIYVQHGYINREKWS